MQQSNLGTARRQRSQTEEEGKETAGGPQTTRDAYAYLRVMRSGSVGVEK